MSHRGLTTVLLHPPLAERWSPRSSDPAPPIPREWRPLGESCFAGG